MNGTMTKSDLIDVLCETQKIPKGRAELLVQEVFESTFSFELDGLDKKGLKQAGKALPQ